MKKNEIIQALQFVGKQQEALFKQACDIREKIFEKKIELRSVIEYSNICQQECSYCGMAKNSHIERYVLNESVVLKNIAYLYNLGRRIFLFQSGEFTNSKYINPLLNLLKTIKERYPDLTIIGCFGNLDFEQYKQLKALGIERYLLKFETSDAILYKNIKPSDTLENRLNNIKSLQKLKFHVSSGNICGLPGQSLESIADDALLMQKLNLEMVSTTMFIPNNKSRFAQEPYGDLNITLNLMAILRILCPKAIIPTTSALNSKDKTGQLKGLLAGANSITIHDGTPPKEETQFIIYDSDRYIPKNELIESAISLGLDPVNKSLIN